MTGTTDFPAGVDDFAAASPANLSNTDTSGRTHSQRHDDSEAALIAIETQVLTVGNLLTANQATPTTGVLTLSGCTEASGVVLTASGTAAYTASIASIAVTVGQVYTVSAKLAPTGRAVATRISWRDSGGSEISAVAGDSIAAGASAARSMATGVAPTGAVTMIAYLTYTGTGSAGNAVTLTQAGVWAGAGGSWAMPGVPITGLGKRVSRPNTDDYLCQQWSDSEGIWVTTRYDSGVRQLALINGWAAAGGSTGALTMQRINGVVYLALGYRLDASAKTDVRFAAIPAGFRPDSAIGAGGVGSLSLGWADVLSTSGTTGVGTPARVKYDTSLHQVHLDSTSAVNTGQVMWRTPDAIPTSLPGTLVSAAPA